MSSAPDIVQILRSEVPDPLMRSWPTVAREAADEIERLRKCYESAVRGRAEFRKLVREMRDRIEVIP